jgi:UDP-2,4-diacetamido-2,4,6-trideoxy-beta-L-altropyranose hydrolase
MTGLVAVFRADASPSVGGGHVMRCLALADVLARSGWRIGFAVGAETRQTLPVLDEAGHQIVELSTNDRLDEPAAMVEHWPGGCDLLVVDHYGKDADFEHATRPWARRILAIDDLADRPHDCEILLDQTLGRVPEDYCSQVPAGCRLLLGSAYALLRPEFSELRRRTASARASDSMSRIFVSLGATDPDGATATVLDGIAQSGLDVEVDVVLGASAPHLELVRHKAEQLNTIIRVHTDTRDMARLMANADLAIGAAGTSSWERCCLGLPTVMVVLAANQRAIADALSVAGAVRIVGREGAIRARDIATALTELGHDAAGRRAMAAEAAALCDGLGATRVMMETCTDMVDRDGMRITLRPATIADGEIMLSWQRDPRTRRHFRNPAIPEAAEHRTWLGAKLGDRNCLLNIIERDNIPTGVLRFDRTMKNDVPKNEVSILVAPGLHGRGIAKAALALGRIMLANETLWADVHDGNEASAALFRSAGFRLENGAYWARGMK